MLHYLVIRNASFFGFSCSYSCSVEDGARARNRFFEHDYEHHFIEHEDFLMQSSNSATSKGVRRRLAHLTAASACGSISDRPIVNAQTPL